MSKTYKTAPYRVRYFYKPSYLREAHDHYDGVCDLPERPTAGDRVSGWHHPGSCEWVASTEFFNSKWNKCPCYMCRPGAFDGAPRRLVERRQGRAYARDGWRDEY